MCTRKPSSVFFSISVLCFLSLMSYHVALRRPKIVCDSIQVSEGNIFFIETNASLTVFSGRVYCAFESAARHNPNSQISVVLAATSKFIHPPMELLRHYSNINFVKVDISKTVKDTPVQELWESGRVLGSKYELHHISDILRLTLLYKYGGTYLDTDVITLKSLPVENYVVSQHSDGKSLNNAVMHFTPNHPFLRTAMKNLAEDFRGDTWGHQGPLLIQRSAVEYCHSSDPDPNFLLLTCQDLAIKPYTAAYAISPTSWQDFFNAALTDDVKMRLSVSFASHYWHHMRQLAEIPIFMNEYQPLYQLFQSHCPITEKELLRSQLGKEYN